MEYRSVEFIFFGILGCLVWIISYWRIFKKNQIIIPLRYQGKTFIWIRSLLFCVGVIGWLFISYSLMGPRMSMGRMPGEINANDIYFVVDVSKSMTAVDFKPNRLEVAKKKIYDFVKMRPVDRIGIIIFSEKAFTLLPLSTDMSLITKTIDEIKIGFLGSGTNIGDALGLAVARASMSHAKNKIVILLTDGVSNIGSMTPIEAAKEAGKQSVKVYTIGIGSKSGAKMPVGKGPWGVRYQNLPGGSIDLKGLKEMARLTGGKDFYAENPNALKDVFNEIQAFEKTGVETLGKVVYRELYLFYLAVGVGIIFLVELVQRVILREAL